MLVEFENLTHNLFINDRYNEIKNLIINYFKSKPKNIKNKYKI